MIFIKNANIHGMNGKVCKKSCILINNDRIEEVGGNIDLSKRYIENLEVIDANGAFVMPGMIDAHCHLGMVEEGVKFEGMDLNEYSRPITPHIRAIDGINPRDKSFYKAIKTGITTVMTGPGSSNPIGGQFAIMKTNGICVDDMIVKQPAAIKIAFGENPKITFGKKSNMPITRMGIAALIRETLFKAENYKAKKERSLSENLFFEKDIKMEALMPVLKKEIPLKAHVHRADDILTAIRIAKEFDVNITLDHCTEAHLVLDYIEKSSFPVILGPNMSFNGKIETQNRELKSSILLKEKGIEFALITDHPVVPIEYLPLSAGLLVKEGLDEEEALKAITINPAKILGISKFLGTIEKGKIADIVIYDDSPLKITSKNLYTIINGKVVYRYNS